MRILHLSDFHLRRLLGADDDGVDARAALEQMLQDCQHLEAVDLVVVSGDVADDGSEQSYAEALTLISDLARRQGAAQAYCTGNHDQRDAFAAVLGSGHFDRTGQPTGRPAPCALGERAAVSQVAGYRVITLDSLVSGEVHGWVSDAQLDWLQEVLAAPSPAGTVLVLHHPPIALDQGAQPSAGLRNASALSKAIEGSDVVVLLTPPYLGHCPAVSGLLIGYARVSTDAQDLTARRDALRVLGVAAERIYIDHGLTGTTRERPGLR